MTTNELTKIWAKISGLFARKTEVATKADKAVVVTLSPDVNQQIVADKTFDEVLALLQGGTEVMFNNNNGFYFKVVVFTDAAILASVTDQAITSSIYWSKTAGITITEMQLQQLLTFDNEPRKASTNPVTSAGLHEALQSKADTSTTYTKTEVNTALAFKANKRRVVDASGADFVELQADAYEKLGTTDAPVVMLPASYTAADEFLYSFTCATDNCVVTLPQGVVLADCCDDFSEVAAGVWFQVSIMDGVAAYLCVTPNN